MQMQKETIAAKFNSLAGRRPYAAPDVTVVDFHLESGFLFSLWGNSTTDFFGDNSWNGLSEGGSFGATNFNEDNSWGGASGNGSLGTSSFEGENW